VPLPVSVESVPPSPKNAITFPPGFPVPIDIAPEEGSTVPCIIVGDPPCSDCKVPVALLLAATIIFNVPVSKIGGFISTNQLLKVPLQVPANWEVAVFLEQERAEIKKGITISNFMDVLLKMTIHFDGSLQGIGNLLPK
jgi:hypothetical protein